jgi:hypothetical protein
MRNGLLILFLTLKSRPSARAARGGVRARWVCTPPLPFQRPSYHGQNALKPRDMPQLSRSDNSLPHATRRTQRAARGAPLVGIFAVPLKIDHRTVRIVRQLAQVSNASFLFLEWSAAFGAAIRSRFGALYGLLLSFSHFKLKRHFIVIF